MTEKTLRELWFTKNGRSKDWRQMRRNTSTWRVYTEAKKTTKEKKKTNKSIEKEPRISIIWLSKVIVDYVENKEIKDLEDRLEYAEKINLANIVVMVKKDLKIQSLKRDRNFWIATAIAVSLIYFILYFFV